MKLKIVVAQIPVTQDITKNLTVIRQTVEFSAQQKADIVLTPEGALSGYTPHFDKSEQEAAQREIEALAKSLCIGMALGTCKHEADGCYNELRFYNKNGEFLGCHTKTLTCGSMEEQPKGEINDFKVAPLRVFDFHGLTIGGLICNDMWGNPGCTPIPDPHLTWQLSKMGAKVIFHAVNGGRDESEFSQRVVKNYHESNLLMRAQASKLYIASVDNSAPHTMPVSSMGGIVTPNGTWKMKLDPLGLQMACCEIEV